MSKENEVVLGKTYTDPVSGFKGVATSRTVYLYGCARIGLQGKVGKDMKIPECNFFDELQLLQKTVNRDIGGPNTNPRLAINPR